MTNIRTRLKNHIGVISGLFFISSIIISPLFINLSFYFSESSPLSIILRFVGLIFGLIIISSLIICTMNFYTIIISKMITKAATKLVTEDYSEILENLRSENISTDNGIMI